MTSKSRTLLMIMCLFLLSGCGAGLVPLSPPRSQESGLVFGKLVVSGYLSGNWDSTLVIREERVDGSSVDHFCPAGLDGIFAVPNVNASSTFYISGFKLYHFDALVGSYDTNMRVTSQENRGSRIVYVGEFRLEIQTSFRESAEFKYSISMEGLDDEVVEKAFASSRFIHWYDAFLDTMQARGN